MMRARCLRDERGAIMLIAVFFAIFAIVLLYYLIGISSSVLFREKFQDAADSAALSAAVMHARGMNLLVLINIVMAAILAVLVTIKLLETLAIIGIGFAAALAWCTFGASLVAIPPLNAVRSSMDTAYGNLQPPIFDALIALRDASTAVQQVTPPVADSLVIANIEAKSDPPDIHGVAFDTRTSQDLPVQDDDFSTLCGRAGELPFQLASDALSPLPGVSAVMGELESPMNDLASSYSQWFCGDGSSAPKPYVQHKDVSYPQTVLASECENDHSTDGDTDPKTATSQSCEDSKADEQASAYDPQTGGCQAGNDCSLGGPYDEHVVLARQQCDPTVGPAPFIYYYQVRSGAVEYTWTGLLWLRGEPIYQQPNAASDGRPPCGPADSNPVVAAGYNATVRNHADVSEVLPVCSNEVPPSAPPARDASRTRTVSFVEVPQILGCKRHETKQITTSNGQTAGSSGIDKSPKRVEDAAKLGDENFQIRAIMHARLPTSLPERVMHLALWNQQAPGNPLPLLLQGLGNFSVAQSEYFYDAPDPRTEWMWNMNWRARLRRFRLPTDSAGSAISAACSTLGGTCSAFVEQAKKLNNFIVH